MSRYLFQSFHVSTCICLENLVFVVCAELEQMKDRFAELMLLEDMSGGGKGVSSALALSNAITNLARVLIKTVYLFIILNKLLQTSSLFICEWLFYVHEGEVIGKNASES